MDDLFQAHKKSEALLQGEKKVIEMIARGDELESILEGSCRLVEEALPGSLAIVLLLDGKRLRRGAAPSFPKYMAEIDGVEIDPAVGTCSAAAARKEQVITADITTDPHWAGYLELAARHGLRAGWSTPILASAYQVLGTFGLYWPEPRSPTPHHLRIIDQIARLVAFAIERKRSQDAISESKHLAQGQLKVLTRTLDALVQESDPERLLEHVLRVIVEQADAHSISVWEHKQNAGRLDLIAVLQNNRFQTFHDTLAQGFTGVIAQLEAAKGAISQRKKVRASDHIDRAGELAREGLREARRSVQALRPQVLEEKPLAAALNDLIERMTTGMTMQAKLTLRGEPRNLSAEWETNLLRIGQEVLTNALRHAQASEFDVLLIFGSREIRLNLRDNGRGFDLTRRHEGLGLRGMRERVRGMGGQFSIESSKGKGTAISVVLALPSVSESGDV